MNKIDNLLPRSTFYPITYTPEGNLKKTFIVEYFFEKIKGCLGYQSLADQKMIAFYALRHLEDAKSELEGQIEKVVEFAQSAQIIPSNAFPKSKKEIVEIAARHLQLTPARKTIQSLRKSCQIRLEDLNLIKKERPLPTIKEEIKKDPSFWNVKTIGTIAVIGAIAAGIFMWGPSPIEMDPINADYPKDFSKVLSPICEKSVRAYCTEDGTQCLKDFLAPFWEASAFYSSNDIYPLCRVELAAPNCDNLVSQTTFSPSLFVGNFERIPALLTSEEERNPIVNWARNILPTYIGSNPLNTLFFKSHIDCINL